jgi:predicted acetyltransferase
MIETRLARLSERLIVRNLMELYQHDFSEIDGTDLDEHGQYGYCDLDCFWINPNWSAYVITVEGKWAGFALTNDEVHIQGNTRAIVEFFVVRKYRAKGIGKLAAQAIMDANPAHWEIRVLEQNHDAQRFWARLLNELWPAQHSEAMLNDKRWHGPVYSVDTQR